jgi:hypothetical protein
MIKMIGSINNRGTAWLVVALTAAVMVGNFYVYDSLGPVADLLQMLIMAFTYWSLWIATALIGVSFSLVPAVMWPLTSKLVLPRRFGTQLLCQSLRGNAATAANS